MKLSDLKEMAIKGPSMENLDLFFRTEFKNINEYDYTADIELKTHKDVDILKVYKKDYGTKGIIYLLRFNDENVGFYQVMEKSSKFCQLLTAYLDKNFRRQKITQRFLIFLKTREGYSSIELGDIHSPDTIELIKSLPQMFNVYWVKDGEKIEYNKNEIDKYYSKTYDTEWQIVLENDCKTMVDWPRFFEERDPGIKKFYSCFVEEY